MVRLFKSRKRRLQPFCFCFRVLCLYYGQDSERVGQELNGREVREGSGDGFEPGLPL